MTSSTVEAYQAKTQHLLRCPRSDLDPHSDDALFDPWGGYAELQRLGAAVWLTKYGMTLTRYDSVMRALKDAKAFSSAFGVMMNDDMNPPQGMNSAVL